jgi:FAD:protein FMN transferase
MIRYAKIPFIFFILILLLQSCGTEENSKSGNLSFDNIIAGRVVKVVYRDSLKRNFAPQADSIINELLSSVGTYDTASILSRINAGDTMAELDEKFIRIFNTCKRLYKETDKAFNVAEKPLRERWELDSEGPAKTGWTPPAGKALDSLIKITELDSIYLVLNAKKVQDPEDAVRLKEDKYFLENYKIHIPKGAKLDFNAVLDGYMVDIICEFLDFEDIEHYMVQVGQVVRVRGTNLDSMPWRIGIEEPGLKENIHFLIRTTLKERALSTEGFSGKVYTMGGEMFLPYLKDGKPVTLEKLSYTAFAEDAISAQAWANVFVTMQKKDVMRLAQDKARDVIVISANKEGSFDISGTIGAEFEYMEH